MLPFSPSSIPALASAFTRQSHPSPLAVYAGTMSAEGGHWSGARELTCAARPWQRVICCYRALIRLAARRERPNGFAIKLEQRSPKPAFVLPEHFESSIPLNFLAADNVVALKTSCHFLFSGKPPAPLVKSPLRRSLLERFDDSTTG
jgi:hypothetical protein